ncbi:telomere repeats-binding bouquet formation protein 1 isoform X1 [Seriola aureovittata]|uniref:telomere repeats-binding bouquet formation protein 1 isoform X1 n=1 Tax=Seriola aureovittata TaxID=2871759 RepID=UPI0024BDFBCF|nr:telomere repeats-binding bouquet formation protein 1 isoform X1 [Seriola aureovittata]XP_056243514.1 telomere repeats-binding bouquet formation protein 1 isoform X1 [Seriola aureovittata]
MDKTGTCNKSLNTIKTDLSLLLECLKFQMKCPDLQKQALLTIHSICEKREDNVDLLREMGGVAFVYNLSKSSIVHSDVKEAALFTLGTLVEANVYCKNSLCRKETFADFAGSLMKDDIPLTQKRVSVYLLSVLVANNKLGQTLAQTTGCLDILLDLFRSTFPLSTDATSVVANATHTYQLWTSVSNALCGCVNNPQNEEGQHICVAAFPIIKIWLQQIALQRIEIFQSICSFISMTVSNNSCVQESFSASGGLETLTLSLVRLASMADVRLSSYQLSVTISKTLSACVTDNSALASGLAQYGIVSHLFSLLASPYLDPEDRLSVLLTLGHCTEASEEHQSQLVQCGGLPLIITLLAEDKSEEVRKTATFILQTCKQATMTFGGPDLTARHAEDEITESLTNMESFRSSARELLHRIDLLEKKQAKEAEEDQEDKDLSTSAEGLVLPSLSPALTLPLQHKKSFKTIPTAYRQTSTHRHIEAECENSIKLQTIRKVIMKQDDSEPKNMAENSGKPECCSVCKGSRSLISFHVRSLEGGREPHTANRQLFKPPRPVRHSVPKEIKCTDEEELLDQEMSKVVKITAKEQSLAHPRCAGCVLPFEKVTSRTFASLQSSCPHSCEMHKALQAATQQFRTRHCSLLRREDQDNTVELTSQNSKRVSATEPQRGKEYWSEVSLTPIRKGQGKCKRSLPAHHSKEHNGITLTPLHRGAKKETFTSYNKTATGRRGGNKGGQHVLDDEQRTSTDHCSTRRKRKDFSLEEVRYLLSGVKTFGFSWNSILWSYPFQPGRTNVALAKKYRQLMRGKTQDVACA